MNTRRLISSLTASLCLITSSVQAEKPKPAAAASTETSAADIQKMVRQSYIRENMTLRGQLRSDKTGQKVPFDLSMSGSTLKFTFAEPAQVIAVDIKDKNMVITESLNGSKASAVPVKRYTEAVRGTDITYEDLTMRFLYWPKIERQDDDVVKHRNCWKLQITTPDGAGDTGTARIWVDKGSGGILKMQGFDRQGKMIKQYEVISGMKVGDGMMLKEMRIESFTPDAKKATGRTYLELEKPE
jgi:outer membrane lipoprotein-sorting protein